MRSVSVIASVVTLFVLLGCSAENDGVEDNFDRGLILNNLTDNIILPAWNDFASSTSDCQAKFATFQSNLDNQSLAELRTAWLTARLSWKNCEPFKFGPLESSGVENAVDLWPINVDGIETTSEDASSTNVNIIPSDRKGFAAIEYLLFNLSDEETLLAFQDTNRLTFLGLLIDNLNAIAVQMKNTWSDSYAAAFKADLGNGAGASTTLLANELIYHVEVIKNYRLATPLGIRSGSETPLPKTLESYYAHESKALIAQSLVITKRVFTGGDGSGFDDYLNELKIEDSDGQALSAVIVNLIDKCQADLTAISGTMQEAITSDKAAVELLYNDLQELTLLIKTDMMSQLGLLVVFSDNDGD
ncbi:imelysin family protein [Reichenbachiella sp. MSK19-1]|uniref:imelysin family protein n=1 Tax=Reichenbachiella sp. MSK19-1 TaxID=1897631 RepID=UPI000E6C6DF7|nr:imelysin family protein [Reichenbachiella sp. MSK19-1]RJE70386.1 hypothetical protein BGP76_09845 [Reichenbachiella sp. MSK19-1]